MPDTTPATLADVPQLARLLAIFFTQEAELSSDPVKQEKALHQIIGQPDVGCIYCAREGKRVLGTVSLIFTISTAEGGRTAWLEDMIVHPDHRNRGLGQHLIQHALYNAQALGCSRITLLTDDVNSPAMRFYERAGFTRSQMVPFRRHF